MKTKHLNTFSENELGETKLSVTLPKNAFLDAMFKETSYGTTANGALTFTRSGSALLDFFAQAGAMRENVSQALDLFKKAYSEDAEKALRILFYLRDVRGGQGERTLFRVCLEWLANSEAETFEKIASHIPEFGRWDDAFMMNDICIGMIKRQLDLDLIGDSPSLLAKWIPTINSKNKNTRLKAYYLAKKLGMHPIEYRKTVRAIRKKIETVEEKMSGNEWDKIVYGSVPSQASRIYRNAFKKHDEKRYDKFVNDALEGKEKINAKTLYPYQIYKSAQSDDSKALDALWSQLPDYTQGNNALVVADVSGSMTGDPMAVSVSLALYFAEKNKGVFKNHFITFSENPVLQKITGKTLHQKMNSIEQSDWGMNTNLTAVFELILKTAMKNNVPEDEMPKTLYIISDMEFDEATFKYGRRSGVTNHDAISRMYLEAGYKKPTLVFWNVNASGKNLPVQKDEENVTLVSGFSPIAFKFAVEGKTPMETMNDVITSDRYSVIHV